METLYALQLQLIDKELIECAKALEWGYTTFKDTPFEKLKEPDYTALEDELKKLQGLNRLQKKNIDKIAIATDKDTPYEVRHLARLKCDVAQKTLYALQKKAAKLRVDSLHDYYLSRLFQHKFGKGK